MIDVDADLSGFGRYIGAVGGVLDAIQSAGFQDDFTEYTMNHLKKKFMAETIAANLAGLSTIKHVFEWGDSPGETTGTPLFKLNISGGRKAKILSFSFLPSTKPVPIDPKIEPYVKRRHVFVMKALVMETQSRVTISPKYSSKLIIPSDSRKRGYILTPTPVNVNPGGSQATGGFASWWASWFQSSGPVYVKEATGLAQETIAKTGQKVIRDRKGRFSSGQKVSVAYINAEKRAAEMEMKKAMKMVLKQEEEHYEGMDEE